MSQERTRFPIQPQDRRRTAQSFDDVRVVPDEEVPQAEAQPQDKPLPPAADDDHGDAADDEPDEA